MTTKRCVFCGVPTTEVDVSNTPMHNSCFEDWEEEQIRRMEMQSEAFASGGMEEYNDVY